MIPMIGKVNRVAVLYDALIDVTLTCSTKPKTL